VRKQLRVLVPLLLALAAGCAKPITPVARDPAPDAGLSDSRLARAASRQFRVRLKFVGSVVTLDAFYRPVVDSNAVFYVYGPSPEGPPRDTVPAFARLVRVEWRPAQPNAGLVPVGSEGGRFNATWVPAEIARDTPPAFAPGTHELVLDPPGRPGQGTVTVRFFAGFIPEPWWVGPDPSLWPTTPGGDGRSVLVTSWPSFTTVPAWPPDGRRYFGRDSAEWVPSRRIPVGGDVGRRTFYEIFGDRIYARSEGDTVHLNSWVVLVNGGYDRDSPYTPLVFPVQPHFPGLALTPQGLIGSPIGFRLRIVTRLPSGVVVRPASTSTYPNFVGTSVFYLPRIAGYWPMTFEGKAYAAIQAEDSHGLRSPFISDPIAIVDRVDASFATPEEQKLRRTIVTFYVR
jgi:hypothetical protein